VRSHGVSFSGAAKHLNRLAREGNVDGFYGYLEGPRFALVWAGIAPQQYMRMCEVMVAARALCETRTRKPLPKPQRQGGAKVLWGAARIARLASAYAKFGPDAHEQVARMLGDVTPDGARMAKRRHVDGATFARRKAA